ncbi:MAG: hypothetical protein K9H84_07245 [Bacteroidales bacterium]|nr:hypothetical protein [Bacteroidales bacterium]
MKIKYLLCVCILFLVFHGRASDQDRVIKNLVFEGAGIRGIAYTGVLEEMEKAGLKDSVTKAGNCFH